MPDDLLSPCVLPPLWSHPRQEVMALYRPGVLAGSIVSTWRILFRDRFPGLWRLYGFKPFGPPPRKTLAERRPPFDSPVRPAEKPTHFAPRQALVNRSLTIDRTYFGVHPPRPHYRSTGHTRLLPAGRLPLPSQPLAINRTYSLAPSRLPGSGRYRLTGHTSVPSRTTDQPDILGGSSPRRRCAGYRLTGHTFLTHSAPSPTDQPDILCQGLPCSSSVVLSRSTGHSWFAIAFCVQARALCDVWPL